MFGEQTLMATVFYLSGYCYKGHELSYHNPLLIGLTFMVLPLTISLFTSLSMTDTKGLWLSVYYPIAIIGTLGIIQIARGIAYGGQRTIYILSYIGSKSLYILIFHFLAFKLISYIYIISNKLPVESYLPLPLIKGAGNWLWITYSIAGITIPLIFWELLHIKVKCYNVDNRKKK